MTVSIDRQTSAIASNVICSIGTNGKSAIASVEYMLKNYLYCNEIQSSHPHFALTIWVTNKKCSAEKRGANQWKTENHILERTHTREKNSSKIADKLFHANSKNRRQKQSISEKRRSALRKKNIENRKIGLHEKRWKKISKTRRPLFPVKIVCMNHGIMTLLVRVNP